MLNNSTFLKIKIRGGGVAWGPGRAWGVWSLNEWPKVIVLYVEMVSKQLGRYGEAPMQDN
jgi:hypothetical protein